MRTRNLPYLPVVFGMVLLTVAPAYAHHEAIFGPQSSSVLSSETFLSVQVFDRENGLDKDTQRQTTTVFSAGFRPVKTKPLSLAIVVPITFASTTGAPATHHFEDSLISARYRVGADRLASSLGLDEGYVMGVGGLELPTGTTDHPFGHGGVGEIAAGLLSVEKHPIAVIGYVYYHHAGEYRGIRPSGNIFAGGGLAWTPIDDDAAGHLFSLQLGMSEERTFASEQSGVLLTDNTSGVFLHPGIVFQTTPRFQFFGLVSLPVAQTWNSVINRQRFRLGAGTIITLGH
jgi:hypothetical protein